MAIKKNREGGRFVPAKWDNEYANAAKDATTTTNAAVDCLYSAMNWIAH